MGWYKEVPEIDKSVIDLFSVGTVVGVMANYIPTIAALLTIIWTTLRIYETKTVRRWLGKKEEDNG